MLVILGCHNKIPHAGWLKQQKLVFSQFWMLEVHDQGTAWSAYCEDPFPGLQMAAFSLGLYMMGDSGVRLGESEGRGERERV